MEEWNTAIEQAVENLGESFDSHDVIREVAHNNQREYVAALADIDSNTPFQTLHSALGKQIRVVCERLGFTGVDSRSPDIFGQNSKCQRWSR